MFENIALWLVNIALMFFEYGAMVVAFVRELASYFTGYAGITDGMGQREYDFALVTKLEDFMQV